MKFPQFLVMLWGIVISMTVTEAVMSKGPLGLGQYFGHIHRFNMLSFPSEPDAGKMGRLKVWLESELNGKVAKSRVADPWELDMDPNTRHGHLLAVVNRLETIKSYPHAISYYKDRLSYVHNQLHSLLTEHRAGNGLDRPLRTAYANYEALEACFAKLLERRGARPPRLHPLLF